MKTSQKWPEKILDQLLERHFPVKDNICEDICYKESDLYMVVDAKTFAPMCFRCLSADGYDSAEDSIGLFVKASARPHDAKPEQVFTREAALELLRHHYLNDVLYKTDMADELEEEDFVSETLLLMPVFGAMIPNCLTLNPTK